MQKAGKAGGMDRDKRMLAGAVRIADLAVHMLCGLENGCTYRGILSGLEQAYKPYQDKLKCAGRLHEIKKGIDAAQNARDRQSLFCCLKSIADTALRMMVYLRTDYALEQERRNSFQMQEKPRPAALPNPPVMEHDSERPSMVW